MKKIFCTILILIFYIAIISGNMVRAYPVDVEFSTQPISDDRQKEIANNLNIHLLEAEPLKEGFNCFDVREDGMMAIGFANGENKTVCVYLGQVYQYSLLFKSSGSFGIEWDGDRIIIYLVRSDLAVFLTPDGEVEEIWEIANTSDNDLHWRNTVFATKRTVQGRQYIARNDMGIFNVFATSYSQLLLVDPSGETSIIYDVNDMQLFKTVASFVGVLLFVGIVVFVLIKYLVKIKRGKPQQ